MPHMHALRFHNSLPRQAFAYLGGRLSYRAYVSSLAPVRFEEVPEPALPAEDWVRVRPRLMGICGSDTKQIFLNGARDNPMTALISFPHVMGHEAVGDIIETGPAVSNRAVGDRVAINPWLSCGPRGIHPPCSACEVGDYMLCRHFMDGHIPPAIHLGNNAQVPGVFAEQFVAHESQCFPVPDSVSDDAAVLSDPFAVSLHSVLRWPPREGKPVLVYGLGTLGLSAVAALREFHPESPIYCVGRYAYQETLARQFGATEVIVGESNALIEHIASLTGAEVLRPWSGVPWLLDGVDVVYDTVGTPETVETSIRLARAQGFVVVSGVEIPARFEWTPLYFKEINLVGSNAFGVETVRGDRVHAIEAYLTLAENGLDLTPMITHRYPLQEWRDAVLTIAHRKQTGAGKVVLTPE